MLRGLPVSIAFHAAIFATGYVSWPYVVASRSAQTEAVTVPIELVDIGELNNITQILERLPDPVEELEPEVPEEEPEDPEEPLDPVDETLPEDEIDTASEPPEPEEAEPEEEVPDFDAAPVEPEDTPEPEQEPEAPIVKKNNPLDDFLNSADNTFQSERATRRAQEPPKPRKQPLLQDTPPKPQEVRRGAGERNANTARLEALLYAQVHTEWPDVRDLPNYNELNVEVRILLDRDGNIIDGPHLISPDRRPVGRSPMRTAVERAMNAVRKAAPYRLPEQDFEDWDDYHIIRLGPKYE